MILQVFHISTVEWWVIWAFVGILIELLLAPGLGMFFISCGALTVAGLMLIFPDIETYQYPLFCIFSFFWVATLWKPIQCYILSKSKRLYNVSDIIGQEVEVVDRPLIAGGVLGQVKWSGTIMNAKLDYDFGTDVPAGTILEVKKVEGNVLICGISQKL